MTQNGLAENMSVLNAWVGKTNDTATGEPWYDILLDAAVTQCMRPDSFGTYLWKSFQQCALMLSICCRVSGKKGSPTRQIVSPLPSEWQNLVSNIDTIITPNVTF